MNARKGQQIRERIIEAAAELFYRKGYEHTSFSDIADAVQISRGNFYYHFKTKDAILAAVIKARIAEIQTMLAHWEAEHPAPLARLQRYIDILITDQAQIAAHGCPIGTLCSELAKLQHASQSEAGAMFEEFRTWLTRQFTLLGRTQDAEQLAMHLIARGQGIAQLANAFRDRQFIQREVAQLREWLTSLAPARQATGG